MTAIPEDTQDVCTYEQGKKRLIDRISAMNKGWSPTPLRKEILSIANRLRDLADDLDGNSFAWSDIEDEHDKAPPRFIGLDVCPKPTEDFSSSYKATLMHMRALADSANRSANSLPNPRKRPALPFAAMGLLHLKVWHDLKIGPIDVDSPVVLELEEICKPARIVISGEAFRNALAEQFKLFDRHYFPPGIWEIIVDH